MSYQELIENIFLRGNNVKIDYEIKAFLNKNVSIPIYYNYKQFNSTNCFFLRPRNLFRFSYIFTKIYKNLVVQPKTASFFLYFLGGVDTESLINY